MERLVYRFYSVLPGVPNIALVVLTIAIDKCCCQMFIYDYAPVVARVHVVASIPVDSDAVA
jgi:hypothetical protein